MIGAGKLGKLHYKQDNQDREPDQSGSCGEGQQHAPESNLNAFYLVQCPVFVDAGRYSDSFLTYVRHNNL